MIIFCHQIKFIVADLYQTDTKIFRISKILRRKGLFWFILVGGHTTFIFRFWKKKFGIFDFHIKFPALNSL